MARTGTQESTQNSLEAILQAIRTTADLQQKTLETVTGQLTALVETLTPLVPILEHGIAAQDGQSQRMEVVVEALVKMQQQERAILAYMQEEARRYREQEQEEDNEHQHHIL